MKNVAVIPNNIVEILSIMGGFLTLITKLTWWLIRSYQQFQFKKSSIKKLYYYTRTKKKRADSLLERSGLDDTHHQSFAITEKSDFTECPD